MYCLLNRREQPGDRIRLTNIKIVLMTIKQLTMVRILIKQIR